jgi:O-antigen ligase
MAKVKNSQSKKPERAIFWLGLFTFLITIYFNAQTQDPFNAPKFWVLILGASWLIGFLVLEIKKENSFSRKSNKYSILLTLLLLGFSLLSALLAQNKFIAFFGDNMRKNGYLTYLCLAVFFLVGVFYIKIENVILMYRFIIITALTIGIYGLMQMTGHDFIKWSDHGNAVISTLGNSNFAGSMMAILATLCFGGIFMRQLSNYERFFTLLAFIILCITIFPTNARQGLLLLFFGVSAIIIIYIFNLNRKLGLISMVFGFMSIFFAILGMLQIGPLTKLLYKDSVSVRGYYWRAGISMFKDHVLFGVGLDNYGSFFKQYREVGYPLKYGYSLTSTNAHNVFIQQFATGGIFVGLTYLILTAFIFYRGLRALKQSIESERFLIGTFFVAWLAFQAQSIISIDNIGITIWGWVLGGAVVGLSSQSNLENVGSNTSTVGKQKKIQNLGLLQPSISTFFGIAAIVLVVFLNRGESNIFKVRAAFNPAIPAQKTIFYDYANKTINTPLIDYQYKIMTASYLYDMGYNQDAISLLEKLTVEDSRNLDVLTIISSYYERDGNITAAIESRKRIISLDPWNSTNYLQLAYDYKFIGDNLNQKAMLDKVLSFAAQDPIVIKAKPELLL